MRVLAPLSIFAALLVGCGSSDTSDTPPTVQTARVQYTKVFPKCHLRLLRGGTTQEAAQKTIDLLPTKSKVEYFAFFPSVPDEVQTAAASSPTWADAERMLKAYEGPKILARRMTNGRVLWETDSKPNP